MAAACGREMRRGTTHETTALAKRASYPTRHSILARRHGHQSNGRSSPLGSEGSNGSKPPPAITHARTQHDRLGGPRQNRAREQPAKYDRAEQQPVSYTHLRAHETSAHL
eukprot:14066161-Alexandrium_andersonii.AAC.1